MEPLLQAEHLTVCYGEYPVVQDVSFSLNEGEVLGIVGESGSGKSTIMKAIMGFPGNDGRITSGDIRYKGNSLIHMSQKELRKLRGSELSMVFQDCKAALCPIRKVGAQIYESMAAHEKISRKEAYVRAAELLEKMGLNDAKRVLDSYPFELSGGMNQRVGICTAMLQQPTVLLADEPTSALDAAVQNQVLDEMKCMRREFRTSMIVVTHNIGVIRKMADKVIVLKDGRMVEQGMTNRILHYAEHFYTRTLLESERFLNQYFREDSHDSNR